jgi:hypothetical protein
LITEKKIIILANNQYCIIRDPCDLNGRPQFGTQELRRGETRFFIQPGEDLFEGTKNILVVHEDEALLLRAERDYKDPKTGVSYKAGQTWMLKGPIDYIPDI